MTRLAEYLHAHHARLIEGQTGSTEDLAMHALKAQRAFIEAAGADVADKLAYHIERANKAEVELERLKAGRTPDGWKLTPREATDDMVRAESARMSAPLSYLKRKWASMWDAAPVCPSLDDGSPQCDDSRG